MINSCKNKLPLTNMHVAFLCKSFNWFQNVSALEKDVLYKKHWLINNRIRFIFTEIHLKEFFQVCLNIELLPCAIYMYCTYVVYEYIQFCKLLAFTYCWLTLSYLITNYSIPIDVTSKCTYYAHL